MTAKGKTVIAFTHPKLINSTFQLKDELKELNTSLSNVNFRLDLFLHKLQHHKEDYKHNPIPLRLTRRLTTINDKITQFMEIYKEVTDQ